MELITTDGHFYIMHVYILHSYNCGIFLEINKENFSYMNSITWVIDHNNGR